MKPPGIVARHPELRWLLSVAVTAALAATVATTVSGVFSDSPALPVTSPAQLVSEVQQPRDAGYFGTIVTRIDLGLSAAVRDQLADALPIGGSLLHGSHILRYWYGGVARQRTAVVRQDGEQDVFRNGTSELLWDSHTRTVSRRSVTPNPALLGSLATPASLTPPQLADQVLRLADSSDTVLRSGGEVAGRPTYELVVQPQSESSRIDSVQIDIDGVEAVPLKVSVYAKGEDEPAIDVAFNSITFTEPAVQNFTFVPPAASERVAPGASRSMLSALGEVRMRGTGWLSIASYTTTPRRAALVPDVLGASTAVHGRWGHVVRHGTKRGTHAVGTGRVSCTPMLCVLATDTGRVFAGAVDPSVLTAAARR